MWSVICRPPEIPAKDSSVEDRGSSYGIYSSHEVLLMRVLPQAKLSAVTAVNDPTAIFFKYRVWCGSVSILKALNAAWAADAAGLAKTGKRDFG